MTIHRILLPQAGLFTAYIVRVETLRDVCWDPLGGKCVELTYELMDGPYVKGRLTDRFFPLSDDAERCRYGFSSLNGIARAIGLEVFPVPVGAEYYTHGFKRKYADYTGIAGRFMKIELRRIKDKDYPEDSRFDSMHIVGYHPLDQKPKLGVV